MSEVALESPRQGRSVLKLSLGISILAVATIVAAVFLVGAPEADAASCTWSGGSGNWTTSPGIWNCSPAQNYPGQFAAQTDTATFLSSPLVSFTAALPGTVVLSITGGAPIINADSGGTLTLASASLTSARSAVSICGGTHTV